MSTYFRLSIPDLINKWTQLNWLVLTLINIVSIFKQHIDIVKNDTVKTIIDSFLFEVDKNYSTLPFEYILAAFSYRL